MFRDPPIVLLVEIADIDYPGSRSYERSIKGSVRTSGKGVTAGRLKRGNGREVEKG